MLDPFMLFGIDCDAQVSDLKTRYHQMALLCHPDRGGTAAQMSQVQMAYEYCLGQLQHRSQLTYEQFAEEHAAAFPPCMNDITIDVLNLPRFQWDPDAPVWSCFEEDGYGESMDAHTDEAEDPPCAPEVTFKLTAWEGGPTAAVAPSLRQATFYVRGEDGALNVASRSDKTTELPGGLVGSDYVVAHAAAELPLVPQEPPQRTLEEMVTMREQDDKKFARLASVVDVAPPVWGMDDADSVDGAQFCLGA